MRVFMVLFATVALIWVFKSIRNEDGVYVSEPPLPQEYRVINQANRDLAIDKKNSYTSLKSPIWITIDDNKEILKKEIIKALPLYANKSELFEVINLLYRSEIIKYREHASFVSKNNGAKSKGEQEIIDKLKEKDYRLFSDILTYLKPAGDKAKEICDAYSYSYCDPYVNVLIDLGSVYNLEQKYASAIPYLETATEHINCVKNKKLESPEQESHTELGLSYLGLRQFDAAVSELEASKPKHMSFSTQMFGWRPELAAALQKEGYTEAAKEYWKAEVAFWEKEIEKNIENKYLLKIKRKMKKRAETFLNNVPE